MNRKMRVARCLLVMGILILGLTLGMTCKKKNQPPCAPSIPSGPATGRKGDGCYFQASAHDSDGDSLAIRFDWGDGDTSGWSKAVLSGDTTSLGHSWLRSGVYSIRAQASDAGGDSSVWSEGHQLAVTNFPANFGGAGDDRGFSAQQTSEGGYIVVGVTSSYGAGGDDVWLIKTDASGERVWDKTLGGTHNDWGNSVQQTSDGGYIIAGYTESYGAGTEDVWLVKTDELGNELWDKTFGGASDDQGCSVEQTSDGGYIIAGWTDSDSARNTDVWLIKTDASGNRVWDRTFGGADYDYGRSVQQTSDGGYVIAGYTRSYGAGGDDVWLIRTDASGNEVWDKTFGGPGYDEGYSARQTSDGGYVIAGYTYSYGAGHADIWLIKTDTSGNKVWDRTFGGTGSDKGSSVQQTSDGGYIIAGSTSSYGAGWDDVWIIRTDADGNEVWDKTFGATQNDEGYSVRPTSDGGCIVAGSIYAGTVTSYDVYLIKTDADGN